MKVFAIGDLHLSGNGSKPMDIFGPQWLRHYEKIAENWKMTVAPGDLVLVPGDISWAGNLDEAVKDLEWLDSLPGSKIIIRGNHDFWWDSISKVRKVLPPSIRALQNDSVTVGDLAITGTRLWQDPRLNFKDRINWQSREALGLPPDKNEDLDDEVIFRRELSRLDLSLQSIRGNVRKIIVMLHFPPVDFRFFESRAVAALQKHAADICVFGHLHSLIAEKTPPFPQKRWGIDFYLTSSDYLDFCPVEIKV